jgi:hypothetical protein
MEIMTSNADRIFASMRHLKSCYFETISTFYPLSLSLTSRCVWCGVHPFSLQKLTFSFMLKAELKILYFFRHNLNYHTVPKLSCTSRVMLYSLGP